jgi:hypothetical protein
MSPAVNSMDTPTISTTMPNEEYHAEKYHISRSTAHRYRGVYGGLAQRYSEHLGKSLFAGNSSTTFGTIVDTAVDSLMQGRDWRSAIAVPPETALASDGSRRGKAFQEWRSSLPRGAVECNASDFSKVSDMVEALREHREANRLLEACTHTQYSVFWTDENGHRRKARADGVIEGECWFDLKTTSSEWRDLKWSFLRFGYDWQASWYAEAAAVAGWPPFQFKFIVVQTFAPFAVKVVTLPQHILDIAAVDIRDCLDTIRTRRESHLWIDDSYHEVEELQF